MKIETGVIRFYLGSWSLSIHSEPYQVQEQLPVAGKDPDAPLAWQVNYLMSVYTCMYYM
jgi:hypothetical protein